MFPGIVAALGRITSVTPLGSGPQDGVRLLIDAGGLSLHDVRLGDSIAIQGGCMTVIEKSDTGFAVDVSRESLSKTVGLNEPGEVNLEKALTLAERLGGHLVSGHVDGLGEVTRMEKIGESWRLTLALPAGLGRYMAYKGSVTINGVSLTVNQVTDHEDTHTAIDINLIPHTVEHTTLRHLAPGRWVNVEIDLIARYCERMLGHRMPNQL